GAGAAASRPRRSFPATASAWRWPAASAPTARSRPRAWSTPCGTASTTACGAGHPSVSAAASPGAGAWRPRPSSSRPARLLEVAGVEATLLLEQRQVVEAIAVQQLDDTALPVGAQAAVASRQMARRSLRGRNVHRCQHLGPVVFGSRRRGRRGHRAIADLDLVEDEGPLQHAAVVVLPATEEELGGGLEVEALA